MKKRTGKNLSNIKGRSKIPNDLYKWMMDIEEQYPNKIHKLDIEYENSELRAIYYTNENDTWAVVDSKSTPFSESEAGDLFEGQVISKADFLIKIIEDQNKLKSLLDNIYDYKDRTITEEEDSTTRKLFSRISESLDIKDSNNLSVKNNKYTQEFRSFKYFSKIEDSESYPDFIGHYKVRDIVFNILESSNLKYKRVIINPLENCWFSVEIHM